MKSKMIRVDTTSQTSLLLWLDTQVQWVGFLFRSLVRLLRMEVWEFHCAAPWQCSQHFLPCRSSAAIDFARNHSRQSDSSFCINCILRQFHTALPWFLIIFSSSFLSHHWSATPPFPYLVPVFLF